jgi:ABC-type amino acid transport substrate-binding protein
MQSRESLTLIKLCAVIAITAGVIFFWRFHRPACQPRTGAPTAALLMVGTNAEYPPFTFMRDGTIVGFDIDVVKQVAERLGKTVHIVDMPFNSLIPQLQTGALDVIAAGMTPTQERAQVVAFSQPYVTGTPLIVVSVPHAKQVRTQEDLANESVIVNDGFTAEQHLATIPGINLLRLPTVAEAFLALQNHKADHYVTARNAAQPFFDLHKDKMSGFTVTDLPNTNETTALAVSPQKPELLAEIQRILTEMQEDGTLTDLKKKWNIT